jgi:poly(beta-D-mannuronate) lyase
MLLKRLLSLLLAISLYVSTAYSQTSLQTSFEAAESFSPGNIHNQQGWTLSSGTASITTTGAKTGSQALLLSATGTSLQLNYVSYAGNVPGITGEVYADMWINPVSFATKGIAINGYDLFGGSAKRIFVIEFGTDNKIKAYNGSSSVNVADWIAGQWVRISIKADFATEKYKVAINGLVFATDLNFRETYTPTSSGTRVAGIKEFHSLRFNHTNDTQVASSEATVDDIYIGTTAIPDVSFGSSSSSRTITVTQPAFGSISLDPAGPVFTLGETITATLTLPQGYANNGWTGDLSGTGLVKNFTINANMTISAEVAIDPLNPPPGFLVTVNQPANGTIVLSPASATGTYYEGTKVTATVTPASCYQFDGWSGDLSGTQLTKQFTVSAAVNIGASISLNTTPALKRIVSTVAEFKTALAAMNPGDTIEVNDGNYNLSSLSITRSGCALRPIIIMAKNNGQAILDGATALIFKNVKYTTLKGFKIRSSNIGTGIKLENCSYFRITENDFAITETSSCTWVYIGDTYASPEPLRSGYNRIDHNIFNGKTQAGNFIRMDGNINQQSRYDTIDHNWFKNNGPRAANEKESIRVGVSTLSKSSGFTTIEYNLFEDCDGDPEIVSIKSCDNTIRYNTFVRCIGTLCLRQGFRSTVEGNYFFGDNKTAEFNGGTIGCGGIRVYGKDHTIINNYFHGLTGSKWDAAITLTNGDVTNASSSLADHYLPENILIAFNTLVYNKSNIEIGFNNNGSYPLSPVNCVIADNIVADTLNPLIKSYSVASLNGVSFSGNIMYPTGSATLGITAIAAEIRIEDPKLFRPGCMAPADCSETNAAKVYRIQSTSPAVDAATGSYSSILLDYEKQARSGVKDIGADEYVPGSTIMITHGAFDSTHVGPSAIPFSYSYTPLTVLPVHLISFTVNPAGNSMRLKWTTAEELNVKEIIIEWSNGSSNYTAIATLPPSGQEAGANYQFDHTSPVAGRNYYRLKTVDNDGHVEYSPVRFGDINSAGSFSIYPNPVKGQLNVYIHQTLSASVQLRLINTNGSVVMQQAGLKNGKNSFNLQRFPPGVYLVECLENGKRIHSSTIVVIQ